MNSRSIIIAAIAFMGTNILGFSILYSLIAFNAVIWADVIYGLVSTRPTKVQEDIPLKVEDKPVNEAQVAFERWLIKKYVELSKNGEEQPIEEIPVYFSNNLAVAEV
jgi:hypothetical protein